MTGRATLVGPSGIAFGGPGGLASDLTGRQLYLASNASGPLFTVDPMTGIPTFGPDLMGAPLPFDEIKALAFDPDTHTLFGINFAPRDPMVPAFLVTIDPVTGQVTSRGQTQGGVDAIAFGPSQAAAVPEPSAFVLSGLGLLGLVGYVWRRRPAAYYPGKQETH
jgi:hypothetical protein